MPTEIVTSFVRVLRLMNTNKKILFIRLDKIGDLVCTLPMDQVFAQDPTSEIEWLISPGLKTIVDHAWPARHLTELDKKFNWKNIKTYWQVLRRFKPHAVICIQTPWWVGALSWLVQVPFRFAVKSKWDSFLFYNFALRQHRSLSTEHEYHYNLQLAAYAHQLMTRSRSESFASYKDDYLHLQVPLKKTFSFLENKAFIVLHPGMAGSALNWPQKKYIDYIKNFLEHNVDVNIAITGTKNDEPYLNEIRAAYGSHHQVIWLDGKLDMPDLLQLLAQAQAVIAPSTGVLHLAASLGVPTHGIYSPITPHHPRRWGARGPHVHLYVPKSKDENCMNEIEIPFLLSQLKQS